jgi:hypothetical protein
MMVLHDDTAEARDEQRSLKMPTENDDNENRPNMNNA